MMPRVFEVLARLGALFRRRRLDRELREEIGTHIALLTEELVGQGMGPEEARREAQRRFGSVAGALEAHRGIRRAGWIDALGQDLRYAIRTLRRQPLIACAVVITLSIGIGAPTSIFSLLNGFVFRTPVTADPEAFFRVIRADRPSQGIATPPEYAALRDESRAIRELAAWSTMDLSAPLDTEDPTRVPGLLVSCNFFHVFGVEAPLAGRLLQPDDCASALPVAVISEALWRSRFGADPAVVGSSHTYGAVRVTIVGVAAVAPIQRQAHDADGDFATDLWFPYTAHPALKETSTFGGRFLRDTFPWLEMAGLLQPGTTREAAGEELRLIEARSEERFETSPESAVMLTDGSRWAATPDDAMSAFALALSLPALIMLSASVNVAALLLSRAVGRQREMAVRLALGSARTSLVRMLLVESLLLSGAAALASLVVVYELPPILVRFFEAELWFGAAESLVPDGRVFAFLVACGVLAALLSGLAPAVESLNPRLAETLQGRGGFGLRRGASRTRRVFVAIQVAASMVLLVAAVTFARTAARFTDPGFATDNLLVAELREAQNPDTPLSSIADAVASTPGVVSVTYARNPPLVRESTMRIRLPGQARLWHPLAAAVSGDYFDVLAMPILAGRSFSRGDEAQNAGIKPVIVSRQLARRLFGNGDPLGETLEPRDPSQEERMMIVGIVADRITGLSGSYPAMNDGSMIYEPMDSSSRSGYLLLQTDGNALAIAEGLQPMLRELTGSATEVRTFASSLAEEVVTVRRVRSVLLVMGVVALLLAILGVVAAVSADASKRTREFAIRLALGAAPWGVRRTVVASGLGSVSIGLLFGAFAAWGAMRIVESMRLLPLGSVAAQPMPYAAISAFLLAAALATLLIVAYPLGRRDPLISLRDE